MSTITPLDIANAMKKMGWTVASSLMQRWADGASSTMTEAVKLGTVAPTSPRQLDQSLVSMSWVKKFSRANAAYKTVIANALNPAGVKQLRNQLAEAGWKSGAFALGSKSFDAATLDATCQTNFVPVGGLFDTLDDFYGAMGKASIKVAVVGNVKQTPAKSHVFIVDALGVYLRDTYDFNGSQPLGVWNKDRCLSKAEMVLRFNSPIVALFDGFESVGNADFRDWRTKTGKGGDYVVYSNVDWVAPSVAPIVL